jgi:ankyrin repeat protein
VKKFSFAIIGGTILAVAATSAAAQIAAPPSIEFVQAVKDRDVDKALGIAGENPSPAILNARDGDGNTSLIIAVTRRDPEWTGFLLNKGADPDLAGKGGDTPLIIASRLGFDEAVGWLLQMGAKVDGTNKMGETALITAVQQRQTPIVRQLLAAGANPDKTDTAAGYSARDYAQRDVRGRDILQLINAKKPKPAAAAH